MESRPVLIVSPNYLESDGTREVSAIQTNKNKHSINTSKPTAKASPKSTISRPYMLAGAGSVHNTLKYPMGACDWCMAWGNPVNAACSHDSDKCLFNPNGTIQKRLGCSYKVLCSGTKTTEINKARFEIFKEMRTNKDKAATANVVQRTSDGKGVTFKYPVATVSINQRVPNSNIPVIASSSSASEPSPTNEESPVKFDAGEEHAAAARVTQNDVTANMLDDNEIDSQLARENEHDNNDTPFFTNSLLLSRSRAM